MAVLRHDLPDQLGGPHFDWLIERPDAPGSPNDPETHSLITFRVQVRPDDPGVARFEGERLPDHRRLYLAYEGPISGGRGRVRRVMQTLALLHVATEERIELVIEAAEGLRTLRGRACGARWEFERA